MQLKNEKLVNEYTSKVLREIYGIEAISGVVDNLFLDDLLYTHSLRVGKLATQMAITMKMPDKVVHDICMAGLLHDLGKVDVPREILYKPGRLTAEEFEVIKKHPEAGYNYVKQAGLSEDICQMVLRHHEKKSGKGYPKGVGKKTIPEEIITVADIFSALSEKRTYHSALEYRQALEFIDSFENLDKEILKVLRQSFDE